MKRMWGAAMAAAVLAGVTLVVTATGAGAGPPGYAPIDRPGPSLTVPAAALADSLDCSADAFTSDKQPILLIPGTTLTAQENFSFNYEPAFAKRGRPYCAVTVPNHGMGDIQINAEYVVSAMRTMHQLSGKKIKIVGFSQGGMVGRWALRFWPDTRADVDELIALDPSNHGTLDTKAICTPLTSGCAPSVWQQATDSKFLAALNSPVETFAGIDYTSIYTPTDELVIPNFGPAASSSLSTGEGRRANISTAAICPLHAAEHLSMGSIDAVGYALVVDALDHDGPAVASRVSGSVCSLPFHEGVNPLTVKIDFAKYAAGAAYQLLTYPHVAAEPPLRGYVFE